MGTNSEPHYGGVQVRLSGISLGSSPHTPLYSRFSNNWDCDPLIPLSVWVGLLVTLLLVSILAWAIKMLTDLQTPNKWDDPKKPGIHVAQAE